MGWFDSVRAPAGPAVETLRLPIFPLSTVLFPDGLLPLKLFEQRYLDMAAACLKQDSPFGVCLIQEGNETGTPATPHPVGTLARIAGWEMEQLGILMIVANGSRRFRIIDTDIGPNNLLMANVELLADTGPTPLPQERERLLPLLKRIIDELGGDRIPAPHRYGEAEWVGYRLSEILPINHLARQKLLELDDPLARLEVLENYLEQRKLL